MSRQYISTKQGDAAMSFSQIARKLGITRRSAEQAYWTGIRKLRRRAMHLVPLVSDLQSTRHRSAQNINL